MESIYGEHYGAMEAVMNRLLDIIDTVRRNLEVRTGMDPVEHINARIKSEDSMREKCRRDCIPETTQSALTLIHDAIGIRVVCAFLDDVFAFRDALAAVPGLTVVNEKDFIHDVKPNGYRSYHMIVRLDGYDAEIQLRTISMDTWAALEHHMHYKKEISANDDLIRAELKRCADELASTDVSLQTLRNMIMES